MQSTDADASSTDARWDRRFRELRLAGALVNEREFSARCGCSARALDASLAAYRLFVLEYEGVRYFPAFYVDKTYRRQQLQVVTGILGALPGGSKWQFFTEPKASLGGRTPLEALARGEFASTRRAAEGFASR